MSYIDCTRGSKFDPLEDVVCLSKRECLQLLPLLKKIHKKVMAKYIYYNDVHEGGYSTTREDNLRVKYEDQLQVLEGVLAAIDDLLK